MSGISFGQNLLSELRLVAIPFGDNQASDESLQKAVTANENLKSLGYTLTADDILRLAASPALDDFCRIFKMLIGDVTARPMYPDFPSQVMQMDEAVFRFHQLIHYFSTYGIEDILGVKVIRGWLPKVEETEKTKPDERLLQAKVIRLIPAESQYLECAKRILGKRERMTDKEKRLIREAVRHIPAEDIAGMAIPFKQNLLLVFYEIFADEGNPKRLEQMHCLCSHTGDVLKCMDFALTRERYHFRSSQKRMLTKLLESYPVTDFKTNLILSRKKGDRHKLMLDFISFGTYSRSAEHKKAEEDLRAGRLRSWESRAKYLLAYEEDSALDFIAKHPGTMLRMTAWLIRLGYPADEIESRLMEKADKLSPQTLITVLTEFGKEPLEIPPTVPDVQEFLRKIDERRQVFTIMEHLLQKFLKNHETPLDGKKVFLDFSGYDIDCSVLQFSSRSEEGGYIRSGLAYRIPEDVRRLRFFVYWNDKERIDIDLHATAVAETGKQIYIGWNSGFKDNGLVHSGDITHSDAAEYIDIDLDCFRGQVSLNVNLFYGRDSFGEIETCYCGMMAVGSIGEDVKLYNPQNCFFSHFLTGKAKTIQYGYVDTVKGCLVFEGKQQDDDWYAPALLPFSSFSVKAYLKMLFKARKAEETDDRESADLVLVMGKPSAPNEISLIDSNFFLQTGRMPN